MTLRNFLLAWHIATRQNPRMAVALEQAIRGKDDLAPFQEELKKRLTDQFSQQLIAAKHVPFMTYVDTAYPPRLREIPQPPLVLFYRGQLGLLNQLTLGIVGSRRATGYSATALAQLLPQLPSMVIASGLAAGADAMAHEAALSARLPTIAVIANGLDQVYPAKNRDLQVQIAHVGLVLSEYPPATGPQRFQFAHGVMVTEAEMKSGSLITANYALQHNREVFALPNRIDAPLGAGTNALIQAGAALVTGPETLVENLNFYP